MDSVQQRIVPVILWRSGQSRRSPRIEQPLCPRHWSEAPLDERSGKNSSQTSDCGKKKERKGKSREREPEAQT